VRRLRQIIVGLVIFGFFCGILLNNLWRFMPEFHHLDTIFCVPLYVQIVLLIISISLGLLLCRKNGSLKVLPLFMLMLIFSMASWYQVNLSNSINSFNISLHPFYKKEVKFDTITTIKMENHKILLKTKSKTHPILTGLYPFGLNRNTLREALNSYGNCVRKHDNRCAEIEFAWP
jgi:hypothetical protein